MRKTYFKPSTGYYRFLRDHEFVTRVNTVLRQHSGTGVERMEIKFRLHSWPKVAFFRALAYGKKWIVREEPYNLTSQFFNPSNGSHLQCLELMAVSLHLPSDFKGFLNLKSLSLVDVSITDEDVECMLSKCNLLEFFEISYCRMVTSIRMLHPLNRFKHLVVHICPKLQEIELNCSPTTLKYAGAVVPLIFASTSRLKNIDVVILTDQSALSYIVTGFPSTLPSLETLTLLCYEPERTIVPEGHFKFTYLRNLGLELVMCDYGIRKTDFLDYAYLLKIAPFLETLELHVVNPSSDPRVKKYHDAKYQIFRSLYEQQLSSLNHGAGIAVGFYDHLSLYSLR
ncbi:F-box/FBD/LRR-repeat protein [Panicum miliaceum]|uniref:F-box/FBD/LRR-repeat protein n=1 Tax=Panicum miliaceum TaxID=4540 RepID=A0A3L6QEK7_PANMI|nr:F-box/FBD/LRR-repeat protein [Panicum miliaceum]